MSSATARSTPALPFARGLGSRRPVCIDPSRRLTSLLPAGCSGARAPLVGSFVGSSAVASSAAPAKRRVHLHAGILRRAPHQGEDATTGHAATQFVSTRSAPSLLVFSFSARPSSPAENGRHESNERARGRNESRASSRAIFQTPLSILRSAAETVFPARTISTSRLSLSAAAIDRSLARSLVSADSMARISLASRDAEPNPNPIAPGNTNRTKTDRAAAHPTTTRWSRWASIAGPRRTSRTRGTASTSSSSRQVGVSSSHRVSSHRFITAFPARGAPLHFHGVSPDKRMIIIV